MAVALDMREKGLEHNDLLDRLAADDRLGLSRTELHALVAEPETFTGAASRQVRAVADRVADVVAGHPTAAAYEPAPIL